MSVFFIGLAAFVFGWIGIVPMNYFGRIKILACSHGAIVLFHTLSAIFAYYESYSLMFASIFCFALSFALGANNVGFFYIGEVCVDQAMGVVLGALWGTEIVMSFLVSFMIDSALGVHWTFGIYAILNVLVTIYVLLLKETKGKSPSELANLYVPGKKIVSVQPKGIELE